MPLMIDSKMNREKKIIQTSFIGILGNVLLVVAKAIIGFIANSISIITDAINNLTDALTSLITIIGTKLSTRKPDRKHPYGHGRIEYVTNLIMGIIITAVGGIAIYESIITIVENRVASYDYISLIIISIAVAGKVALGLYFQLVGKKTNSDLLKASGKDALFDALLSTATIIGIITTLVWNFNIEGWIGILIGCFIIKTGIEVFIHGISLIVGERADNEYVAKIKKIVCSFDGVYGAYDLIVNNYGTNKIIASVHIEVDDSLSARDIHHLTRKITAKVYEETGTIITIGIYAKNETNDEIRAIKKYILERIKNDKNIRQLHGFYVDDDINLITFDLVMDFDCKNPEELIKNLRFELIEKYPKYNFYIIQDTDFAD